MRICLYTQTALPKMGGQEMVVDTLARQFQELGHEPVVLAPFPRRPLRAIDRQLPYPVARHPRFYSSRFLVHWYRFWLMRLYRRFHFDILHCHGPYPPGYLAALCRPHMSVPFVITSHGGDIRPDGLRQGKAVVRRRLAQAIQAADSLVSLNGCTTEGLCYWGADPARIVTIPNGVHVETFARRVDRPVDLDPAIVPGAYVLYLGRLVHQKGVDLVLQALRSVAASGQVQFVIAGGGEKLTALRDLTTQLHLNNRVRLVGPVAGDTKTYLLQNALCTVIPSRFADAFPLVLLESFAAGTPVLGTRVPGLQDLIEPGQTGWLVAPESPAAMADALGWISQQPGACREAGRQAARVAEGYSWRRIARQHLSLYEQLLHGRRSRQVA
jgi:glycosyltransferase involved in cell wall biosynthesis